MDDVAGQVFGGQSRTLVPGAEASLYISGGQCWAVPTVISCSGPLYMRQFETPTDRLAESPTGLRFLR